MNICPRVKNKKNNRFKWPNSWSWSTYSATYLDTYTATYPVTYHATLHFIYATPFAHLLLQYCNYFLFSSSFCCCSSREWFQYVTTGCTKKNVRSSVNQTEERTFYLVHPVIIYSLFTKPQKLKDNLLTFSVLLAGRSINK